MAAVEGEPELLVADPGGHRAVTVNVEVRGDSDQHPLPSLRQTGEVGDLDGRIQHDAPDPESDRGADVVLRLRVAVHDDAGLFHATCHRDGEFSCRADVDSEPFFVRPACHRDGQQGLAGVEHFGVAQGRAIAAGAAAEVGLVDHVGGGAELVGDIGQGYLADTESSVVVGVGRDWPDRRVESRRSRKAYRRQDVRQSRCHDLSLRADQADASSLTDP